jgi:AraC-like DNA-binding protein
MILRRKQPGQLLGRFVEFFWFYEGWEGSHTTERVLPDGTFELVINLSGELRKQFHRDNPAQFTSFQHGWVSGAHSRYILIDSLPGASMIGAHFRPGGIASFIGSPAAEFRDQVIEFEAVWGGDARRLREQLLNTAGPNGKLEILEQFLSDRLRFCRPELAPKKRITWATAEFCRQPEVGQIGPAAEALGISHKHFIAQFQQQVGMTPKLFCRIRRFQEVLAAINAQRPVCWADLACQCGYFDQAHLIKDFQAFAGLNPSAYRSLDPDYANFVPVNGPR